jgi:hypothetical protein
VSNFLIFVATAVIARALLRYNARVDRSIATIDAKIAMHDLQTHAHQGREEFSYQAACAALDALHSKINRPLKWWEWLW